MERFAARKGKLRIGIVGKYMELHDAYKSICETPDLKISICIALHGRASAFTFSLRGK
jgi:CTP synthase (UTP-ammonia lyase)